MRSIRESLDKDLKRDLIYHCLISQLQGQHFVPNGDFAHLVYDLPKLDHSKNFGSFNDDELFRLGVCSVPNFKLNALVCEKLANRLGDLSMCDGFYKIGNVWRLDIDEKLSRNGLLLPIRSRKKRLIYGLNVFRYPDDERPFWLKTRKGK
jgi:hypothetical protein